MLITNAMQLTAPMYIRITTADSNFKFEHLQLYFLALNLKFESVNILSADLHNELEVSNVCLLSLQQFLQHPPEW